MQIYIIFYFMKVFFNYKFQSLFCPIAVIFFFRDSYYVRASSPYSVSITFSQTSFKNIFLSFDLKFFSPSISYYLLLLSIVFVLFFSFFSFNVNFLNFFVSCVLYPVFQISIFSIHITVFSILIYFFFYCFYYLTYLFFTYFEILSYSFQGFGGHDFLACFHYIQGYFLHYSISYSEFFFLII